MEPFGATIFCDDIREELYGKVSLIGIYSIAFASHAKFPISLPKFGFYITACFSNDDLPISDVTLQIYLPQDQKDKPSFTKKLEWQMTAEERFDPDPILFPDPLGVVQYNTFVLLGPVVIKQNGFFRVRLLHKDKEIKIGALEAIYIEPPNSSPEPS
jgi:hypothetical protein